MYPTRLRDERRRQGFDQTGLAIKSGVHRSIISVLERGLIPTLPSWCKRLSEALNVPEDSIFHNSESSDFDEQREKFNTKEVNPQ